MRQTTKTMNRVTGETMERKPGEQMMSRCESAKLALLKKPLSASVQSAPDGKHPVAS